ncbi:MAG TPA: hypothetical protein VFP14_09845 [Novosphingobium sp.]|nr:hypothetical protein [Novosphingobium sp.]
MRIPTMAVLAAALVVLGCSPALDWREFEPEGSGVIASFPCRPDHHSRTVPLAGASVRMEMFVCNVAGTTFALTYADMADPAAVGPALGELKALAGANIGAAPEAAAAASVPGMTPHPQAGRVVAKGRRPDGGRIEQQALVFAKGVRVYQASVVGSSIPAEAAETFLGAPRPAR